MRKGSKHSLESRLKMSESLKGRVVSEKTKEKIRKGRIGKSLSEETKKKISIAQKNLPPEKRENINNGIRYKRYTEEYGKKLSDTKLGEVNPQAKLTEEKVRHIKFLWKKGTDSTTVLGNMFNISRQAVADIVYGRTWKHIDE